MKLLIIVICIFIAVILIVTFLHTKSLFSVAQTLVAHAVPFTKNTQGNGDALLVLGDSTAVGVGASAPEDSIAGLLTTHQHFSTVENYAVSGAETIEVLTQISQAEREAYDTILLQIGANDIIRLHSAQKTARQLAEVLTSLPPASNVYVLTAGDIGSSRFFPFYVRSFHSYLSARYHVLFNQVATDNGARYINLYTKETERFFIEAPEIYYAEDLLHPSSRGYQVWFGIFLNTMGER
jgi:lysophospholipase L1-like esterase